MKLSVKGVGCGTKWLEQSHQADGKSRTNAPDAVVLGGLSRDVARSGFVGPPAPAPTGDRPLRDRVGKAPHAQARDGWSRPRAHSTLRSRETRRLAAALEVGLRGGRALENQARVMGAVQVRGTGSGRIRLQVVPDASARSLTGFVNVNVAPEAVVRTDGGRAPRLWQASATAIDPEPGGWPPAGGQAVASGAPCVRDPPDLAARDSPKAENISILSSG
jgi:hypothetical protein